MKYTFKNIDTDTTELTYKDKRFEIRKDVDLIRKMQSLSVKARTKMMLELSKQGISKQDLVIEKKDGNKTTYDNSNLVDLEQEYYNLASVDLVDELCNKYFNMGLLDLLQDMELKDNEVETFSADLMSAFSGIEKSKFPSIQKTE